MGMYEEARAAANEALVAHINFVRKLIANRLDISERSIRLLPEEMRRAATMAASSALMTSFRPHLLEIANERPEILDGPVASGETLRSAIAKAIARTIADDLSPLNRAGIAGGSPS